MDIFLLVIGGYAAVVALGVWVSKAKVSRLPYFLINGGFGALSGVLSANGIDLGIGFYFFIGFICGWSIGGRCNDAGLTKLHALWAWIPILWLGLLFPSPKLPKDSVSNVSELD